MILHDVDVLMIGEMLKILKQEKKRSTLRDFGCIYALFRREREKKMKWIFPRDSSLLSSESTWYKKKTFCICRKKNEGKVLSAKDFGKLLTLLIFMHIFSLLSFLTVRKKKVLILIVFLTFFLSLFFYLFFCNDVNWNEIGRQTIFFLLSLFGRVAAVVYDYLRGEKMKFMLHKIMLFFCLPSYSPWCGFNIHSNTYAMCCWEWQWKIFLFFYQHQINLNEKKRAVGVEKFSKLFNASW